MSYLITDVIKCTQEFYSKVPTFYTFTHSLIHNLMIHFCHNPHENACLKCGISQIILIWLYIACVGIRKTACAVETRPYCSFQFVFTKHIVVYST
jgi:hypothetical protein